MKSKDLECPNCGSPNPKEISHGEFECKFCETKFVNQAMMDSKRAAEKQEKRLQAEQAKAQAQLAQAKATSGMGKRVLIFVAIFLLIVFGFVGYMAKKSMDQANEQQKELMKSFETK
jgi:uncharacterized Zn finger protein (UPF0148 family)